MWHLNDNGAIDDEIFGSRTGKTGDGAILGLQVLSDYSRVWKQNLVILFNDADGCFDQILPVLADIALRRVGTPTTVARAHTELQLKMKHYIKTAVEVSKGYIQYRKDTRQKMQNGIILLLIGLIGGIGQGGGGSPIIWMVVLMIMMATYKESQSGAEMWDAVTCERIRCWIISYVDDNTLVQHFRYSDSVNYILQEMKKSLQEWHTL